MQLCKAMWCSERIQDKPQLHGVLFLYVCFFTVDCDFRNGIYKMRISQSCVLLNH